MFQDIVIDFSWASLLILLGYFLRMKVKILQDLFIPVSVIAGILGLLLGSEVLGRISPFYITWSENVSSYANPLLAILMVSQFLTLRVKATMIKKCSLVYLIAGVVIAVQILLAMPFVRMFSVPDGFALLPTSGFFGAHGFPGMIAGIFQTIGYWDYDEAFSVGNTFATFGMLWGVIVGVFLINVAARRGWLAGSKAGTLGQEEMTGYIEKKDRKPFMMAISTSNTLNPLAFHCAIIGMVMVFGYLLLFQLQKISAFSNFAITIPAMVIALIINIVTSKTKIKDLFDGQSLANIGGMVLEYLIVTSVATTNLAVVTQYISPILLISIFALVATTIACFGLSKIWLKTNWFENGIVMFGAWTGSTATGLMLLRVSDPDQKTDAAPNLISATPFWQLSTQSFPLTAAPYIIITAAGFRNLAIGYVVCLVVFLALGMLISRKK